MALLDVAAPNVDADNRVYMRLDWSGLEAFLALKGEASIPRITYVEGCLELTAPSASHESIKTTIARLVEAYAEETELEPNGFGSWTVKRRTSKRALEPDECYVVGPLGKKQKPDLAIEVIWTSGGIEKLDVYVGLGVGEVWLWERGFIGVWKLRAGKYVRSKRSGVVPGSTSPWWRASRPRRTNRARCASFERVCARGAEDGGDGGPAGSLPERSDSRELLPSRTQLADLDGERPVGQELHRLEDRAQSLRRNDVSDRPVVPGDGDQCAVLRGAERGGRLSLELLHAVDTLHDERIASRQKAVNLLGATVSQIQSRRARNVVAATAAERLRSTWERNVVLDAGGVPVGKRDHLGALGFRDPV